MRYTRRICSSAASLRVTGFKLFHSQRTGQCEPALLDFMGGISQCHDVHADFKALLAVEDNVTWVPSIIAGRRTLFVAAGTIDAYVDLAGLVDQDVMLSADGKSATVRLPKAQLDEPNLDHDRSYVFSQDRGVLDRIADAMETPQQAQFYKLAETKLAAAAEDSELRKRAAENTKSMLTGLFKASGISVTFLDKEA
jgi:hypothetical protein